MSPSDPIRIAAIGGSVRPDNFTMKALSVVADRLRATDGVSLEVHDPAEIDFPLPGRSGGGAALERFRDSVRDAHGVLLATPEYHGGPSSVIKLAIENLGFPSSLAGKPIALLGVAAGAIGAIQALGMLRSIGAHVGGIVLPGAVSVAGVQQVFDESGRVTDPAIEQRLHGLADGFVTYLRDRPGS